MSALVGKILANRYRVDQFLGRGGMAEVYKVWDIKRMAYLAMKVLHQDMAEDRVFLRRFTREAQTLAKLEHPNIVRFHGLERDGRLAFMLMEFVDGQSLRTEIFDTPNFQIKEIRAIIRSIARALHYAHKMGYVHCDIKPANIMLNQHQGVKLSDFGIARVSDGATATMVGAGSPAYMAPEQVLGQDPTPQSDIYSLGIVLFEMLTGGERPFTGERASVTGSMGEKVRWEQINIPPISPRLVNEKIPQSLETVILTCLQKDPRRRYKNIVDFLNAFELAIQNLPADMRILSAALAKKYQATSRAKEGGHNKAKQPRRATHQKDAAQPVSPWLFLALGGIAVIFIGILFLIFMQPVAPIYSAPPSPIVMVTATFEPISTATLFPTSSFTAIPLPSATATLTNTPLPTMTATIPPAPTLTPLMPTEIPPEECPGVDWASQPGIEIGGSVNVCTKYDRLIVRVQPEKNGKEIMRIYPGSTLEIISGRYCGDKSWWWEVVVPRGTKYVVGQKDYSPHKTSDQAYTGFVREGSDSEDKYYICP